MTATVLAALLATANALTNIPVEDPLEFIPWNTAGTGPIPLWIGDYTDVETLSCQTNFDMLFDWLDLKRSMSLWLRASLLEREAVPQIHWERIRPIQHALTNLISLHDLTTSRDCFLGMMAVRFFYLILQTREYRDNALLNETTLAVDWFYMVAKFKWSLLLKTGWAPIFFASFSLLGTDMQLRHRDKVWTDCDTLPRLGRVLTSRDLQEIHPDASAEYMDRSLLLLDGISSASAEQCPMAYAHVAAMLAFSEATQEPEVSDPLLLERFVDASQSLLMRYHERHNHTFANLLLSKWEFFQMTAQLAFRVDDRNHRSTRGSCGILWCPEDLTPNPRTCKCEIVFTQEWRNHSFCIFVVDNRRRSSLRNITSILNARYWTLSYGINRAYAHDHGYEIDYVQPDPETHYPQRKIGWAKVKVLHDALQIRGPQRCEYGVSLDSDAYIRTSESLSAIVADYALDDDKLILFSEEYHVEEGLREEMETFINGGFFIVRNSPAGLKILEDWYNVPDTYQDMAHLKKENPQGLNMCWDRKMQPKYSQVTVLGSSQLFTAPLGLVVRHNWFKDLRFEQEMQDILLQRLHQRYGCIVCQNVYDWDDSNNTDPGWR